MVRGFRGSAAVIKAQEREIEVVAWKIEIIRVATEESGIIFHGEGQPDIGIFAVIIELVFAAPEERNHLTAFGSLASLTGLFFNSCNRGIPCPAKIATGLSIGCGTHRGRHIPDALQYFGLHARALLFLVQGGREKPAIHIILIRRGQIAHAAHNAMVIGEDQTLRRDHGSRTAACETHGTRLHMIEPLLVNVQPVFLIHLGEGKIVGRPHAFIGKCRCSKEDQQIR